MRLRSVGLSIPEVSGFPIVYTYLFVKHNPVDIMVGTSQSGQSNNVCADHLTLSATGGGGSDRPEPAERIPRRLPVSPMHVRHLTFLVVMLG